MGSLGPEESIVELQPDYVSLFPDPGDSLFKDGGKGKKNVLILMSDTGGGHRASAEAIKQTFEKEFGDKYKVSLADLWKDHFSWPFNRVPGSYNFLVKYEFLWNAVFHFYKPQIIHQSHLAMTASVVAKDVARMIGQYEPDVIVSVHPLMQHIPLRILETMGLLQSIPFTTVITDLSVCHPTWYHKHASLVFCPTKEAADEGVRLGLKPTQLRPHGLPVRLDFSKPLKEKSQLRRELGLDPDLPAVLLMGGGEGMGPVEATARALAKTLGGKDAAIGQLVVVCGRNKRLEDRLKAIDWPMPTVINGFVSNMPEWMGACNIVITKAGPGTIAESMIMGLPMIINGYIVGQEVGNVPYVVENGAGKFSQKPKEIADMVARLFGPKKEELEQMAENSRKLGRPDAVLKIVRDLDELARRKELVSECPHVDIQKS